MPSKNQKFERAPTTIRPRSLRRVKAVLPFTQPQKSVTDFISEAADAKTRELVETHHITLPADASFETDGEKHKRIKQATGKA